ncbi:N-acetyltransferase [Glaciihabitans arcticus]|uniref:N-acetyltransferase n=1 Tax=Glaciihabitans arcticus TaxID=2668039 RepID=A0A4Q9GQB3_9MICO|nr:GNAT family N-acetyltransferase [Glaciihabitans arcticus]TBN56164.1 N-acetyltransferase [Glaciihabitans arcticus]
MTFTIEQLVIPATVDEAFAEMVRVRNEIEAESVGNHDLSLEPAELLPMYQRSWQPKVALVARVDGRIVGRAIYDTDPPDDPTPVGWISIEVLPDFRRRGIGAALYDALLALAASESKTVLQGESPQKATEGPVLESPTGFGSVPRDSASTRFALARGFSLEQVARMSRLDLPFTPAPLPLAPDYHLESWAGRTPVAFLEAIALLRTRMQTDAPFAGLEPDDNPWTAERVSEEDDALESSPRVTLTTLAVHTATGAASGFTELTVPPELRRPVMQGDTIVLKEHRGHRLGMILKLANLAFLDQHAPGHPSVTTFNAEENRPMLSVNEEIGFVAWGYEGVWKKVL